MQLTDVIAFLIVMILDSAAIFLFTRDHCKLRFLLKTLEEKNWCDIITDESENKRSLRLQIKETKLSLSNNKKILIMSFCYTAMVFLFYIN